MPVATQWGSHGASHQAGDDQARLKRTRGGGELIQGIMVVQDNSANRTDLRSMNPSSHGPSNSLIAWHIGRTADSSTYTAARFPAENPHACAAEIAALALRAVVAPNT
jgi:hypothetical protein